MRSARHWIILLFQIDIVRIDGPRELPIYQIQKRMKFRLYVIVRVSVCQLRLGEKMIFSVTI